MAKVPVTLLSGFVGAGKTTLLKNLLQNKTGLKVGVLVNDVAELSLDAALISKRTGGQSDKQETIELQNGCACCSAAEELLKGLEGLLKLAAANGQPWDHIVVEASGVAEPREIRDRLRAGLAKSPELLNGAKLHAMVTVVDASTFVDEFEKRNKLHERPDLGSGEYVDSDRQVCDLMCEQLECADILVLNKADLIADANHTALLKETVGTLNSSATVYTSESAPVELTAVLGAAPGGGVAEMDEDQEHRRTVEAAQASAAAHSQAPPAGQPNGQPDASHGAASPAGQEDGAPSAQGDAAQQAKRAGVSSFSYQRRLPFHPHRLMSVIRELPVRLDRLALSEALNDEEEAGNPDGGALTAARSPMRALIRAKGFVWLSNSHSQIFYWALSGKHFELKHYAAWWDSHPRGEWPKGEKDVADIMRDFDADGDMGDRRQELVFVGVNMDAAAITQMLDECLLKPSEMAEYRKRESIVAEPDAVEANGA